MNATVPFPAALEALAPDGLVAALGPTELGVFYRLVRFAWTQDEPCTLPDHDATLAMVAGVDEEAWCRVRPRLAFALQPDDHGRLRMEAARRVFDSLAAATDRRRGAGRTAAQARWGSRDGPPPPGGVGGARDAGRMRIACESDAKRMPSASLRPESKAPAPCAIKVKDIDSAPLVPSGAERSDSASSFDGAGARALRIRDAWDLRQRQWCFDMLSAARWHWAPQGKQWLPTRTVRDLAEHPNATPLLCAYALQVIEDKRDAGETVRNPVGLVINVLGAQRDRPGAPWPVPLQFAANWDKRMEAKTRLLQKQAELDATRSERMKVTPGRQTAGQ